jgi:putative hydrolases of HD superfamily
VSEETFLYNKGREYAHIDERTSIRQIATHHGNPICDILELWDE